MSSIQCQRHDCQAAREDLRRVESARVAILAENTYYKQRVADLTEELRQREDQLRLALDQARAAAEPAAVPTMPGELARHIERKFMVAVMEADDAFQKAGATGTKTWIRDFLLSRLEANGLGIGMKEHVRAAQPPGDDHA